METFLFFLILVPLAWGYLLASRLLRESQRSLRWGLAYALGLLSFLVGVNAFFHLLPLRTSVFLTIGILAAGSAVVAKTMARPAPIRPFSGIVGPLLAILALTAFFEALFWQMQWSDDDFFVHGPLMALALRDVFPTHNPFFPSLSLPGHYGRDLTISAVSVLVGERFLAVQYFVTAANQAAAVLILHGTARRFLRSPSQALWVVFFAFAGINFDSRRGLLETFQNNNSFAFLFLFVNLYLFLSALSRRSRSLGVLCGLSLGTYALIYETSYGLLCIAVALFPFLFCALRRRWRLRYFTLTTGILLLSGALALVQGGLLTDAVQRRFSTMGAHAPLSQEDRRISHDLEIRVPKPGFTITAAFQGDEYPLWSRRLAEEAGTFVFFLPVAGALMAVRRKPWALLVWILGVVAILVPAGVDFGAFNSESLRFLLVGGVCAAMLFGVALGMLWDWGRARGIWTRAVLAGGLACVATVCFLPSARFGYQVFRDTANYPRDRYLVGEEWGCTPVLPERPCEPIDVSAAVALRPFIHAGDRVLTDFKGDDRASAMLAQATFMTFARAFLTGPGLRVLPTGNYSQSTAYWDGAGFRARAFFGTGDVAILDDLGARYVYFDPENIAPDVYRRIVDSPRLERVLHLETPDGAAAREAYRVRPASPSSTWAAPDGLQIRSVELPARLEARRVYPLRLGVSGPGAADRRLVRISYEIRFPTGQLVTQNDEVRLPLTLRSLGKDRWVGTLWLATPYDPGEYEVRLYGWDANARAPLRDAGEKPFSLRVRID